MEKMNRHQKILQQLEQMKDIPPLLARITLAGVFILAGFGKIRIPHQVGEYFLSLGLPHPLLFAHLVGWTEFLIGICLLLGLFTRIAVLPLFVIMTVAILKARIQEIHRPTDLFNLTDFLYMILAFWLLISGPGRFSFDQRITKKR